MNIKWVVFTNIPLAWLINNQDKIYRLCLVHIDTGMLEHVWTLKRKLSKEIYEGTVYKDILYKCVLLRFSQQWKEDSRRCIIATI